MNDGRIIDHEPYTTEVTAPCRDISERRLEFGERIGESHFERSVPKSARRHNMAENKKRDERLRPLSMKGLPLEDALRGALEVPPPNDGDDDPHKDDKNDPEPDVPDVPEKGPAS